MTNLKKVFTLTLACASLLLMVACNTNKEAGNTTAKDNTTVKEKIKPAIEMATSLEECMDDRKTTTTHEDVNGKVLKLNDKLFVISINADDTKRYKACNLPQKWEQDGLEIVFSGLEKEIMPNERWPGTPLRLTAIAKK